MLDTNIFDRLDLDDEAVSELENRRDLRLVISDIQRGQLAAIPDAERRERYLEMASRLCVAVSAAQQPSTAAPPSRAPAAPAATDSPDAPADRHGPDRLIAAAAAARCDLLVTDDNGLLEYARRAGVRAMDWTMFARRIIFEPG
jgi:predicted nucleic acid-binding protein